MPTLQVRDLPEEIYAKLNYLAEKEHRSLAQETIVLIKKGMENKLGGTERRKTLLKKIDSLQIDGDTIPDPVAMVREDRDR